VVPFCWAPQIGTCQISIHTSQMHAPSSSLALMDPPVAWGASNGSSSNNGSASMSIGAVVNLGGTLGLRAPSLILASMDSCPPKKAWYTCHRVSHKLARSKDPMTVADEKNVLGWRRTRLRRHYVEHVGGGGYGGRLATSIL
jgi:hypothetical protein